MKINKMKHFLVFFSHPFLRAVSAALLFHALIAGPLLVQCIPSNGTCRLELIGQDPCRHLNAPGNSTRTRETAITDYDENTETCVDLAVDYSGLSKACLDLNPPSFSFGNIELNAGSSFDWLSALAPFKLAREPEERFSNHISYPLSLRI
jgi:hypothetical protein